jgi:hypothetical protein
MRRRSWRAALLLVGTLAAGATLNRTAVHATLSMDDFAQRAMIEGKLTPRRGPFNLYDFIADDNRSALLDRGVIPWWSEPHLTIRFLRPLPSLLVWVDHRLFGSDPFWPHVLSFLWWGAAVFAAHVLYRTVVGERAGRIATVIFALSPTLAVPLVWLASRSILLTLTFGALALALYVRWRNERRAALAVLTCCAFAAAALTGEYALCLGGYLIAFELCRRDEAVRARLIGALPAVVPLLIYAGIHAVLGYGSEGSGFYRDPSTNFAFYMQTLPRTLAALLASAWLNAQVNAPWLASGATQATLIVAAGVLAVGTVWAVRRQRTPSFPVGAAWLACGSVIGLFPLAATEPTRRLLGIAVLGIGGALGVLLDAGVRRLRWPLKPSSLLGLAALATLIHVVVAPLQTRGISVAEVDDDIRSLARFKTVPQRARSIDTVLVVRANNGLTALSAPFVLDDSAPNHWLVLSHTFDQTAAIRTSPSSLQVVQDKAPLFPLGPLGLIRTTPFREGDVVQTAALRATVLKVDDAGRPLAVQYEFNRDLDGPGVVWISEGRSGFSEVIPPPVGIGVRLAP